MAQAQALAAMAKPPVDELVQLGNEFVCQTNAEQFVCMMEQRELDFSPSNAVLQEEDDEAAAAAADDRKRTRKKNKALHPDWLLTFSFTNLWLGHAPLFFTHEHEVAAAIACLERLLQRVRAKARELCARHEQRAAQERSAFTKHISLFEDKRVALTAHVQANNQNERSVRNALDSVSGQLLLAKNTVSTSEELKLKATTTSAASSADLDQFRRKRTSSLMQLESILGIRAALQQELELVTRLQAHMISDIDSRDYASMAQMASHSALASCFAKPVQLELHMLIRPLRRSRIEREQLRALQRSCDDALQELRHRIAYMVSECWL
jgi:hypothetical protein